jgi:hypothetical protein
MFVPPDPERVPFPAPELADFDDVQSHGLSGHGQVPRDVPGVDFLAHPLGVPAVHGQVAMESPGVIREGKHLPVVHDEVRAEVWRHSDVWKIVSQDFEQRRPFVSQVVGISDDVESWARCGL